MKDKIYVSTDFIGVLGFSRVIVTKVSGNIFRSLFFYLIEKAKLIEKYDKKIDAIVIIKNGKDNKDVFQKPKRGL